MSCKTRDIDFSFFYIERFALKRALFMILTATPITVISFILACISYFYKWFTTQSTNTFTLNVHLH